MNIEKMVNYRVSKGHNREESIKLFSELVESFHEKNLAYALHYNQFITLAQSRKMSAN